MSEMSVQLQQKFNAVIDLQKSRVQAVIKRTPPEKSVYGTGWQKRWNYPVQVSLKKIDIFSFSISQH